VKIEQKLRPQDMQIVTKGGVLIPQASTSVVGSWVALQGPFEIYLPVQRMLLDFVLNMAIGHSAADAYFGIWALLYENADTTGVVQSYMKFDSLLLPRISAWAPVGSWLGAGLTHLGTPMPVGTRYVWVWGKNYTTGTLTFGQNNGVEFFKYRVDGV